YFHQLLRTGVLGLVLKASGPWTLFHAIGSVVQRLQYFDPEVVKVVNQTLPEHLFDTKLTESEVEVLVRLDLRNKEIAEEIGMSLHSVEHNIDGILKKFKVATRTAAALKASALGLVLIPKMSTRDPETGKTHEEILAEKYAEEAIRRSS